jgi:hypothetical protein
MAPRARRLAIAVVLAATMGADGCSSSGAPPPPSSSTTALSAVVDQFRDDYASGTIVLQLDDRTAGPITVVRAELADSRFEPGTVWSGSIDLSPDQPISLPAVISQPRCAATPAGGPSVAATLADGRVMTVSATDPHAVLPRLITEKCFAQSVARLADLRLSDDLSPGASPQSAVLELIVAPPAQPIASPADSGLTLASVGGTTLLDQDPSQPWPRNLQLVPGEPAIRIAVRPARCDPHAVAEDKVGTLIPLTLDAGGQTGVVKVAASDRLKASIYAFVARACGWQAAR